MTRTLFLDLETYSEEPIASGNWNYAHHPSTEIMLATWCFDDEPEAYCWDATTGEPCPTDLRDALDDEDVMVVMQNGAQFDRTVMRGVGFIDLPCERICDTMVQALSHGLPGALDKLGMVFGLAEDEAKDKAGRQLIHFFCKPNRGKRNTRLTHPEKWEEFKSYALRDTTSMRIIHGKLPRWNYPGTKFFTDGIQSDEHKVWCLDQKINNRGVMADVELAEAAVTAAAAEKTTLDDATYEATDGDVTAATQRDKLLQFILKTHGITLPDMRADTLQRRLDDPDLPWAVKHLLDLRLQSSRNSSAKYKAVLKSVCDDDRLRFTMQFCGAATTGRWSGRVFQPQNMMRPTMKMAAIAEAIEDVKAGLGPMMYSNLPEVLGNCVRGVVVAPKGRKLVAADLKSIEGRGLGWLAGEDYITQFYHDFDAGLVKHDSYQLAYTMVAGGDPALVTKAQRQIGKPIELGFGYGGGVAAFLTFAAVYHLDLEALADMIWDIGDQEMLQDCKKMHDWAKKKGLHAGLDAHRYAAFEYTKRRWREARPKTVQLWADLAEAFTNATLYNKTTFKVRDGLIQFRRDNHWLRMRLPSGRFLVFLQPKIESRGMSYMGLSRYTRQWSRVYTHGGKLSGIGTQAFASDVLRYNMPHVEDHGYDIVLTVHDEAITEAPDESTFNATHLSQLLTRAAPWAPNLPLAADGFEAYRYRKDD